MPKISPFQMVPTQIKQKTNFNATQVESKPESEKPGQTNTDEGKNTESHPLPPQYEALAKKESALREMENGLKAEKASLDARIKEAVDKALSQYREQLKSNPLDVLNNEGLTYEQLVEQAVNQTDPKTREIEQRLKQLTDKQKELEEQTRNAQETSRASAIKQIEYDVTDLVDGDAEYETIKTVGAYDDVVQLIVKTFDETGKMLSVEKAAKMVEDELLEQAVKIASSNKVKAKLAPQEPTEQKSTTQKSATTLTNEMTAKKPMSARERAIARFKGENF